MTQFPNPFSAEGSDHQWRRPEPGAEPPEPGPRDATPAYSGPPPTLQPPPGWRPPTMITIPAPRQLPPQDPDAIETTEHRALVMTYGLGMIAGAIGLIVLIILCGRVIF